MLGVAGGLEKRSVTPTSPVLLVFNSYLTLILILLYYFFKPFYHSICCPESLQQWDGWHIHVINNKQIKNCCISADAEAHCAHLSERRKWEQKPCNIFILPFCSNSTPSPTPGTTITSKVLYSEYSTLGLNVPNIKISATSSTKDFTWDLMNSSGWNTAENGVIPERSWVLHHSGCHHYLDQKFGRSELRLLYRQVSSTD